MIGTGLRTLLGAWLVAAGGAAAAGEQAERAVAEVKRLVAAGEIKAGAVLRLRVKQGNIAAFLGRGYEFQGEWEKQTGTLVEATVMPQLDSLGFIRQASEVDLTVARNHEYPDLVVGKLIEDLTPYLRRFGFSLPDDPVSGYILPERQAYFMDRVVAIPADGDFTTLVVRKDLLDDPANQARFRERFRRDLKPPRTWQEYQDLVEFFHRPGDGFYGALEPREKLTGWMYWLPRYASQAFPNQYLFGDDMRPLIDSPAGVAATESYIATIPFSPPEVLEAGRDYSYTLPFFLRGNGFSTMTTMAGAKIFNLDASIIKSKFLVVPMPGTEVAGKLVRRPAMIYGNNLVVPRTAPNKTLAFLFAMWLTDPDISARSVAVASGFSDPYRYNHLSYAPIRKLYTDQALEVLRHDFPLAVPSGTGLPGDAQYLAALDQNLWLAARKEIPPREAMARTAREWEAITERLGRASQIAHWKAFKQRYPMTADGAR